LIIALTHGQSVQEFPSWKEILDNYNMDGTILVYDQKEDKLLGYNPARWDSGYLPASTFKIVNSLVGLETGVVDTTFVFKWNGQKRRFPQWEQDLNLREAFQTSCLPCYQEVARKIGALRMNHFLDTLHYGHMDVHPENIDLFWLEGNSRITPDEQLDFIKRLYNEELPLSLPTMKTIKNIMIQEETPEYRLSGKTGWSIRNGNNYGWFVGVLETMEGVYFMVVQIEPKDQQQVQDFAIARKAIAMEVFREMGVISE
ncbi:MAG: class D beta-lactamase, partial [Bacteroidetes bacterium]